MESQDIRKVVIKEDDTSTSRIENGDEVTFEEMDTTTTDDRDQVGEDEALRSDLPVDTNLEEGQNDDNQHEEESAPFPSFGRLRKSRAAKRQQASGRSLTK